MTILPVLFCCALAQDPQPAVAVPGRLDQVELQSGEVLEGRIVVDSSNYLEIELGPGATVGFRTNMVAAIRRGAGAACRSAVAAPLVARDEWFTLHDGTGTSVGWLHSTQTSAADGSVVLQEEWDFQNDRRQFQVTLLETADAELRPISCYFRERVREAAVGANPLDPMATVLRTRQERIVEATVDGRELAVHRLTPEGRSDRRLPWPDGATFPLLARASQARRDTAASTAGGWEGTVFDAATEEMQVCRFAAARPRLVPIDGASVRVEEVVEQSRSVANAIWRDAGAHVLRREVAGPALVAVPSSPEQAVVAAGRRTQPAPFVADADRRFGLWCPNPVWEIQPANAGTVALVSALHHASITLSSLTHLDAATSLDAAVLAVERWALLLHPEYTVVHRDWVRVRDRQSARIECASSGLAGERVVLHVVPSAGSYLVLRCCAPLAAWAELQADFAAVADHLELEPAVVATLVPAAATDAAATDRAMPASPASPSAVETPATPLPVHVRVPYEPEPQPQPAGGK